MIDCTQATSLLDAWDKQQASLVAMREERFETMLWVLERMLADEGRNPDGDDLVVLDVACGPGAISKRVLTRFPGARAIAIDLDPSLLEIARSALGPAFGERIVVVEADLAGDWRKRMPEEYRDGIDAALSATALHWLMPDRLVAFYTGLAEALREGGVFMNADHLRYNAAAQPGLTRLAELHDIEAQEEGRRDGALSWDAWWALAREVHELVPLIEERDRRFARNDPMLRAPTGFHLRALTTAGFNESGVLTRYLDNLLVYGRR